MITVCVACHGPLDEKRRCYVCDSVEIEAEAVKYAIVKEEKKPWTICPDCGVGPGVDHKPGCLRSKAPQPEPPKKDAMLEAREIERKISPYG